MCGQFATEQFGIGTCDDDVHFLSQHTIDEQVPSFDILYLIKEKILKVSVYLIQNLQHVVQLVCLEAGQPFIIEVSVCKLQAVIVHSLIAKR